MPSASKPQTIVCHERLLSKRKVTRGDNSINIVIYMTVGKKDLQQIFPYYRIDNNIQSNVF
jgi:hypothetical protein